jgi:hypothetical protein
MADGRVDGAGVGWAKPKFGNSRDATRTRLSVLRRLRRFIRGLEDRWWQLFSLSLLALGSVKENT